MHCHIFACLSQRPSPKTAGEDSASNDTFRYQRVCHGWRVMARSAPELWCSVSLCVRPYIEDHSEFQAELLDQWLQLAKAWPLSIVMTFDKDEVLKNDEALENDEASENDEAFDSQSEECLAALAAVTSVATSHSHQWESLHLFLPFSWAKIFESGMGHCPNLKSLYLHIDVTERVDSFQRSEPPFSTTFRHAPKLRTVTIGHEINVGLPYHQLEELTLWDYAPPEGFLSECTNLKILRAHECCFAPYSSGGTVHLSNLLSLELITLTPQDVLGYLVTPSLVSITIPLKGSEEIEAFLAFLTYSGVTLKHLSIIDYVPREEKLLWKIFDALPNLSHLEIDEPFQLGLRFGSPGRWLPSGRFFNYFSTPNMTLGGLPLPHLTSVKYRGQLKFQTSMKPGNVDSGDSVDVDTLEKVFLARWNSGLPSDGGAVRLQAFSLLITDSRRSVTKMEQSLVVKELRKEGMRLVFKFVEPRECMKLDECW